MLENELNNAAAVQWYVAESSVPLRAVTSFEIAIQKADWTQQKTQPHAATNNTSMRVPGTSTLLASRRTKGRDQ